MSNTIVRITKNKLIQYLVIILAAVAVITVFSKSSFLYTTNDWADTNIYFSIGKALLNGQTMYTDIFDHKGTLMYLIYLFAAWIDSDSFFGVYLVEIAVMTLNGILVIRLSKRFGLNQLQSLLATMIFMLAMCGSRNFWFGGSAEELCFPCFLYCVDQLIRLIEERQVNGFWCGFSLAWIFWIKFTMVGIYIGLVLFGIVWLSLKRVGIHRIMQILIFGLLGFLAVSLPVIGLMGLQGNLIDWFDTYIYANLFRYGSLEETLPSRLLSIVYACLSYVRWNPWQAIWCIATIIYLIFRKQWALLCGIISLVIGCVMTIYWGNSLFYYGLPLFSFGALGILFFFNELNDHKLFKYGKFAAVCFGLLTPILLSPTLVSTWQYPDYVNMLEKYSVLIRKETTSDEVSVLNYRAMDTGLSNMVDGYPHVKYFFTSNIPERTFELPYREQDRYLAEGVIDFFVTTRNDIDQSLLARYELVSEDTVTIMDSEYIPREITYYLYQLRGNRL